MTKKDLKEARQQAKVNETQFIKEVMWTNRIVKWIVLTILLLVVVTGIGGYFYIKDALKPVNPNNNSTVEVTVPIGSGSSDIADILKANNIVKNADIFSFYLKFNNDQELQAGHYEFSQAMTADEVIDRLQAGGKPIFVDVDTKITVIEGMQLEKIAKLVGENTGITDKEFMDTVNDEAFIKELQKEFPSFLEGVLDNEEVKYPLEGYLFPATYDYFAGMEAQELIKAMVSSANLVYQSFSEDLVNTHLTYREVLTLASIIEKEANTVEDRGLVSGVFYNRLYADMPLESDITVLYALGVHKEFVTYKDLEVDSAYNLYKHTGVGPGPFNTPSRTSIQAAIYPTWNDYYYFVADIETGDVYYSVTLEEHEALVEEYVNSRQSSLESDEGQDANLDENQEEVDPVNLDVEE